MKTTWKQQNFIEEYCVKPNLETKFGPNIKLF